MPQDTPRNTTNCDVPQGHLAFFSKIYRMDEAVKQSIGSSC